MDSAEPTLVEKWMSAGHLPNLARLKASGVYGHVTAEEINNAEAGWATFFTGCQPQTNGYWHNIKFKHKEYTSVVAAYDYVKCPPFYALGNDYKVAAFDLAQARISNDVNGIQVIAWGAHSPQGPSVSKPADLLPKLNRQYGTHPALRRDDARVWRKSSLKSLQSRLKKGIEIRRRICLDLLKQESWDLFLTVFSETHSVGHYMWHLSQPDHPLYEEFKAFFGDKDLILEIYQDVDSALGDIVGAASSNARVVVFSQEGMETNNLDVTNMAILPEFLYRFNFPGETGLTGGTAGSNTPPPPPVLRPLNLGWVRTVWSTKTDPNPLRRFIRKYFLMEASHVVEKFLGSPRGPQYPYDFNPYHQPALWYSPYWPEMRAFVLPTFSDGHIRVNLRGRERDGIVDTSEYEALCDEITERLYELTDPRTQERAVKKVIRTRTRSELMDPDKPDGDLVVKWNSGARFFDVVDSPVLGRVGPFPNRRAGGHTDRGFFVANGPGIPSGSRVPDVHLVDLAPMILEFMGAPVPKRMDGKSPIYIS